MATLDSALRMLPSVVSEKSHEEVTSWLQALSTKVNALKPEASTTADGLLLRAIDLCKIDDPKGAVSIVDYAEQQTSDTTKLRTIKASCLDRLGEHDKAKQLTLEIVEEANADLECVLVAANLLVRYNQQAKALEAAKRAYEGLARPAKHTGTVLYISQRCADFEYNKILTDRITKAYLENDLSSVAESPRTNLLWSSDERMNIAVTKDWARRSLRAPPEEIPFQRLPLEGRRLRIGYLSSDFREHPTLRLMMGAFRNHDPTRFEFVLFCSGWDDGSAMRKEAVSLAAETISVTHLNDKVAAQKIRDANIDVLVELNGPTRATRMSILAERAAPVQVDYLGWAGSVGGRGVDYVVGDDWTVPKGAEQNYPERVMRASHTYQINDHAHYEAIEPRDRSQFGLPEDGIVFGVFNAINKIQGDVWSVWMELLKRIPNSVLWILDPGDAARKALAQHALRAGVDVKRIIGAVGMTNPQHLARIQVADLMLDPWPYGGHTSTSDALYAGVPVLTMNGTNFPGRVSAGLLRAAGLPELVAANPRDYLEKACILASRPDVLAALKRDLRQVTSTPCFDSVRLTRELETMFATAYKRWAAGHPAVHISCAQKAGSPLQRSGPRLPVTVASIDDAYGSEPPYMRQGPAGSASATPVAITPASSRGEGAIEPTMQPSVSALTKKEVILVCGAWGGGTSVMAQIIVALGATSPGEMISIKDPMTDAYEMKAFRAALWEISDQNSVKRKVDTQTAISRLRGFSDEYLASETGPIMLKHPLAALFIPELSEVFDLKLVNVLRPLPEIEKSRARRGWAALFGQAGARVVYSEIAAGVASCQAPALWVRYEDLISNPYNVVSKVAEFTQLQSSSEAMRKAISLVRTAP